MNSLQSSVLDVVSNNLVGLSIDLKNRQNELNKRLANKSFDTNAKSNYLKKFKELYPYIVEFSELKTDKDNLGKIMIKQKKIVQDFVNNINIFTDNGELI